MNAKLANIKYLSGPQKLPGLLEKQARLENLHWDIGAFVLTLHSNFFFSSKYTAYGVNTLTEQRDFSNLLPSKSSSWRDKA